MAQPTAYQPAHEFLNDEGADPLFPGTELDVEFAAIDLTLTEILANLALIQRDDGGLANGVVTYDSLSPTLQTNGIAPASPWTTATDYVEGDAVVQGGSVYRAEEAHTSGTFSTDLANDLWTLIANLPVGDVDFSAITTATIVSADLLLFGDVSDSDNTKKTTLQSAVDATILANGTTFPNTGLRVLDTNASHDLIIKPGSDLVADRTFTLTTGDADRTLDISAASVTISAFMAGLLDDADEATFKASVNLEIGTDVQAHDADLAALAANSTNGLWARTGAGSGAARTIAGTANEVSVADGDGVSGNPTISLPSALTFTGKTVTGGTFSGPTIAVLDTQFTIQDDGDPTKQVQFSLASITSGATRTYTLPNSNTTVVGTSSTQTLTNKTFDLASNTLTGTLAGFNTACSDADFLSVAAAAAAYQPLDSDLTAIAALTTTAAGRSALAIVDPNADRILAWDDSAGAVVPIALADITDEGAPASGDFLLVYGAEGDLRRVDWADLPGAAGGIASVVEDTTPQLGGMLDVNGQAIGDGTRELLTFVEDASAVNHVEIENQATGGGPIIRAAGDDTNIDLILAGKGTGVPKIGSNAIIDAGDTASDSAAGIVELATAAETTTGTDTARAVTPDGLAGSNYGKSVVSILVFDDSQDVTTGDGAGDVFWRVPATLNGFNLVAVAAKVQTAGTTNTTDIQIHNVTQAADMLSTKITIDSTETDSATAAAAAVIDTGNDDVATGDAIRIDVDAVSTTKPKGLLVELTFQLP